MKCSWSHAKRAEPPSYSFFGPHTLNLKAASKLLFFTLISTMVYTCESRAMNHACYVCAIASMSCIHRPLNDVIFMNIIKCGYFSREALIFLHALDAATI